MLMNYIALQRDTPARMHFTDHYYVKKEIPDPDTGKTKWVDSLVFWCDKLDGETVAKTFSIISTKLAETIEPYLKEHLYRESDFTITKTGESYATAYTVEVQPRGVPSPPT
ncbi:MAG: hypothetical protein KKB38_21030 [Gammaproteobacteria bacterium]|nr:hypothetical protein [Gammaproteobacteria bacterium]